MLVWGGHDSYPGAQTESDFHLFDFGLACWVKVTILELTQKQGQSKLKYIVRPRRNQTMTSVMDTTIQGVKRNSRLPWVLP